MKVQGASAVCNDGEHEPPNCSRPETPTTSEWASVSKDSAISSMQVVADASGEDSLDDVRTTLIFFTVFCHRILRLIVYFMCLFITGRDFFESGAVKNTQETSTIQISGTSDKVIVGIHLNN